MKLTKENPFFYNRTYLYLLGFLVTLVITFLEVSKGRHHNFIVFAGASRDFWLGISPYSEAWIANNGRFFLYMPDFSILFSPFAMLPSWLGPFAWNIFNFSLFFLSIFNLPAFFSERQKANMFLFTFLILAQSLLSFQYNITVAYIFLFAYSLLERKQYFWAILLIMISGMTKVYGIFQLGLLLCYPQFWRNIGYVVVTGIALFLLPLVKLSPSELLPYYQEWIDILSLHHTSQLFDSIYYVEPFLSLTKPYYRYVQLGALCILAVILLLNRKKYDSWAFRAQALGVLMGWTILFSDAAEKHTYVIALAGYMLWYWSLTERQKIDKIFFWAAFVLLCVVPIDIIIPKPVMNIICYTLWLNVWIFLFIWIRMVWITFLRHSKSKNQLFYNLVCNTSTT